MVGITENFLNGNQKLHCLIEINIKGDDILHEKKKKDNILNMGMKHYTFAVV